MVMSLEMVDSSPIALAILNVGGQTFRSPMNPVIDPVMQDDDEGLDDDMDDDDDDLGDDDLGDDADDDDLSDDDE